VSSEATFTEKTTATVLLVDDFEPWRRLVSYTLEKQPGLQIIGEASDGLEAVQKAQELQPDLILLDIGLPKFSGIEAARQIRTLSPKSKILFLSQECSGNVLQEAFRLGACGYILKSDAGRNLLVALGAVLGGKNFFLHRAGGKPC
jgi:DNA-binding NarL/FixJ family response regulator